MISLFGSLRKATAIVLIGAMFFGFSSPVFAGPTTTLTAGSQVGALTAGIGGSSSYSITLGKTGSNGLITTMTTSGLPSGVIGIFFPNPIIYTNTGATTTLTLLVTPFATAGVTSFTIKSTDLIGTVVTTPATLVINGLADTTAPVISQVTAIPALTKTITPEYTFTTNEAGTITYGGSCTSTTSSANVGTNTLTLSTLADGAYSNCTITVKDAANNVSNILTLAPFIIDTTAPVITINPYNTAPTNTDIVVTTSTNEGNLNTVTHTFTANGSFDFVATDAAGNVTTSTVTLTNIDKEAPVLGLQANITQEATSSAGAVVTFTVNSIDNVDVASLANCSSTSGSVFPNGTTTVTCTKTDASGNAAEPRIFTIEVVDTTAPTVGAASDIVVSTSGANGIVTYTAPTATDLVDGDVPVFCTPASGSSFPLNTTTTVTCTATDSHGKIGSSSFDVIASDTGAPTLVIPGNMTVEATSANGAVVVFVATATDDIDASPLVSCTPASGSTFPLGTTTVSCSASDNAETPNTANGTFTITIVDTTLPVITLLGDSPMILIVGTPYVEPGATVSDGNATLTVTPDVSGTVDSNTLGTYTLTYTVKDAAGNSAEPKTRTVQVIATDTTPPVISEVTPVPHPTNILTPSYTFTTNEAGTITHGGSCSSTTTSAIIGDNILTFKALTEGYYSDCTLTVKDAANNTSTVLAISPFAIDTTPPVITLTGAATMTLTVGGTYTEEGATANDGESSLKVAITGSVNTGIPGTYVLTYTATDSAGNSASITRTVQVDAVVVVPPENTGGGGGGAPSVVYACRDPEATNYKTSGVGRSSLCIYPVVEPTTPVEPVPTPAPAPAPEPGPVNTPEPVPVPTPTPASPAPEGTGTPTPTPFDPQDATLDGGGGASPEDVPEVEETFDPKDATLDIGGGVSPEGNNNALLLWLSGIALSLGLMWWFIAWRRRDEEEEGTRRAR